MFKCIISIFAFATVFAGSNASPLLGEVVGGLTGVVNGVTDALPIPQPQSKDPFYQPPSGFEGKAPGDILRTRKVASAFVGLIPDPVEAHQLLYRTTAQNGSAIVSVTTVFKPLNAKKDRFVSFQTAYDGAARSGICDPSYNYQLLSIQFDLISSVEFLLLQAFLLDGNIVSSSDYEGPDAAFTAGRLSGMGVLDSMRAVTNFKDTLGFSTDNPKVVGYGYSGGAIATGWAASLQPSYAPELAIKGWAQGGTPANLTGTAVYVDGTLFSGFLPQALAGLSAPTAYGEQLLPVFDEIITPYGQSVLDTAKQICSAENILTFTFQSVQSTKVQTLGDRIFYEPTIRGVLDDNLMGQRANETPTAPVYIFHAPPDEIIPYENATTLRDEWCGYGADVEFVTIAAGGHATTEIIGFPGAFQFVQDAFEDKVSRGCSQKTVLNETLNPLALGVNLEPILVNLLNGIAKAGKKDGNILSDVGILNKTLDLDLPLNLTLLD